MHSLEHERTAPLPAPPRKGRVSHGRGLGMATRIACVAVAVGAIALLCWQIGVGIGRVGRGEMTGAQMLTELGQWLRGGTSEQPSPTGDESGQGQQPNDDTPEPAEPPSNTQTPEPSEGQDLYSFDRSLVPEGARAIVPADLFDAAATGNGDASLWQAPTVDAAMTEPIVLIVHSHGGEGYTPEGTVYLQADALIGRSDDAEHSVVGVGEVLADALNENGIGTIHLSTRFDIDGNAGAFERTADAIAACLGQYPTIRYVIDIHRDAGLDGTGDLLRAVTWHDGAAVAQTRLLVPAGDTSSTLAAALCEQMNTAGHHLCYAVETQEFGKIWIFEGVYTLRAEIGTAGNSAQEAARAAEQISHALGELLK